MTSSPAAIFTIGHSNHPIERFVALLRTHGITRVLDVRAWPRSRRHPQFDRDALTTALAGAGIGYTHVPELGGMRPMPGGAGGVEGARPGAPRARAAGWSGAYRAHMQTVEFARGLARVIDAARSDEVAMMCAEADPGDCHRRYIADALVEQGLVVRHAHPNGPPSIHTVTGDALQGELGL